MRSRAVRGFRRSRKVCGKSQQIEQIDAANDMGVEMNGEDVAALARILPHHMPRALWDEHQVAGSDAEATLLIADPSPTIPALEPEPHRVIDCARADRPAFRPIPFDGGNRLDSQCVQPLIELILGRFGNRRERLEIFQFSRSIERPGKWSPGLHGAKSTKFCAFCPLPAESRARIIWPLILRPKASLRSP